SVQCLVSRQRAHQHLHACPTRRSSDLFIMRRNRMKNVGPPMSAVKMPIGKSAKEMRVREPISAPAISSAPPRAEAGMRTAFDGQIGRASCRERVAKQVEKIDETSSEGE